MIGHVEFNSATFYRYAVVDVVKLERNRTANRELALKGLDAFAQAMARAIPSASKTHSLRITHPALSALFFATPPLQSEQCI
jgi:CRISPR system Cascade subunit CasC